MDPLSLQSQILGLGWHTTRAPSFHPLGSAWTDCPPSRGDPWEAGANPQIRAPGSPMPSSPPPPLQAAIPLSSVSMPLGARSVQCPFEEAQEEAREAQGLEGAQPSPQDGPATLGSEPHTHRPSSHGDEAAGDGRASLQDALHRKSLQLVAFLLLKYRAKELTTKAEMLELVAQDQQDPFPVTFSQASKDLQLVFGMDVKEVDPSVHSYVLVPTLGLTWDGVNEEQRLPKTGLLALLLGVILL